MTPESMPHLDYEGEPRLFRVTTKEGSYAVVTALDLDQAKRIGRQIFQGQPVKAEPFNDNDRNEDIRRRGMDIEED